MKVRKKKPDEVRQVTMSVEELQRLNALDNAVRYRLIKEESSEDVVKAAQKYLDFLQGKAQGEEPEHG